MTGRKGFSDFSDCDTFGVVAGASVGGAGAVVDFFRLLVLVTLGALDAEETPTVRFGTSGTFSTVFVVVVLGAAFALVETVDLTEA